MPDLDLDVPPGYTLFEFGSDSDLVPARYVPYLRKFQWQTFRMASGVTQVIGKRHGLWYTADEVLKQCSSHLGHRFKNLSSLEIVYDRSSCWKWRGNLEYGAAICIHRGRKMPVVQAIYEMMGLRWVSITGHKCGNLQCGRPSHFAVTKELDHAL